MNRYLIHYSDVGVQNHGLSQWALLDSFKGVYFCRPKILNINNHDVER